MSALVDELRELVRRVDQDEDVALDIADAATRAAVQAATTDPAVLPEVVAAVKALEEAVERAMDRIEAELRQTGTRRGAITAYGAVRSHKRAQNVRTRA